MNSVNKLTWKYFWQQKLKEVSVFISIIVAIVFIPYLNGLIFFGDYSSTETWGLGLILLIPICMVLAVCVFLFYLFYSWINDNWVKAKARARRELKK